ncbi:hemagglutinin repeat-containing protein [Fusobacterium animalis]|uniref:hemagglutinin repeat-containing protein n=1 Tax=Fusobacterium animalis TaxID=76859 RepID=UPI003CC59479
MYIKFEHTGKRPRKKVRMEVTYTRDFADDYITKKIPVLDKDGKPVLDYRGRPKYKKVKEYIGRYAYVTGSPSVIEGKNVVINPTSIVKQQIDDANGKINEGDPKNKVIKVEREVHQGIKKDIKEEKIDPNQINVKDELKKYGNIGTDGAIYNGNNGINGQITGSTKVIDEIIKNGKIDTDASLPSTLFIKNVSPNSKYLLETRPKYINQNSFYGSDYFLSRVGYEDKWNRVKRLGDAYYENELIERSITEKLGTRFLNGKEISAKELMDNAAIEAKKNGLTIGKSLTKEQIAKLDKDIIWYEYQTVDGIQVLAPKIYLSQNTLKNLNTDSRSRITGIENTYVRTGNLENTGLIGGYGNTYVEAKEVNNRTLGNQLAEIRGNNTTIIAQNNINNIGARISANENLNLAAINGDIVNKSTIEKVEFNNGEFDRSKFTKIDSIGEIVSNNNLNILTNNYTSIGAITQAKNANINVANDINILSQETNGEQKFGKDDSQYNYYGFEKNIGSEIKAENLNTTAKNFNISGSVVTTKTADLNVDKLNIESKVDKEDEINKTSYKGFLKSGSKKETIHNEENSAGSLYVEGKGAIKGDVNLVGSNLVLGNDSFVGGKVTTDSRELHSSYSLEEKKKGFSGSIGSGGFSVGYGKSESKLKEKDLTNAKSNLVLGDGTVLNKGADITATNLIHGQISINNGDVKFGARKDTKDVETSSKSSGVNLSVRIKSQALDRAKQGVDSFKQMKSGDILGGITSSTNTVTGVISGLASNQGTKLPLNAVNADNTVGKDNLKAAQATNNFYANVGVNLGFNKSSSKTSSHNEAAVVTTIKGKDENSSITYNNVKNIEYVGTQAKDTKFIYNNVDNITKKAVELNNYSSSSSKNSGVSAGVTIGYGDGVQTEADAISISASKSNMNTDGTTYQNGLFVNVDEVHNNTKNMTLSGFNQVGGKVTGNIENLTIESKQNTSNTTESSKSGSIGFAPNGMPNSISANYSQTNGERRYVDTPTTFIIGDGSNLKVGKVENTAGAIGATGNGKLSIDEYIGHNLENKDETKTKGGSLSLSPNSNVISGVGINYANKDLESVTRNTVVGNVEIGKTSGDEINKDLSTMTEVTKDKDTKTNVFVESQTIKYALNPEAFKEDLKKAKNEIHDIYHAVDSTVNPQGKESRNVLQQLAETRQAKTILNVVGSRLEIAENQDDIAKAFEGVSEDLGYKVKVIYTDPSNSPQLIGVDKNGNPYIKDGTAYVDKKTGIGYILINTESPANRTKAGVIGTIAEEQSHIIGKIEGRQKVVPDGSEKGLESLGRPTNNYFKNEFSKNDKAIGIVSDGKDYSNVDFGENVGDGEGFAFFKASLFRAVSSYPIIYKKDDIEMDPIGMTKKYKKLENEISLTLEEENFDISSKRVHTKLSEIAEIGGTGYTSSPYEGLYVIDNEDVRSKILDKDNNLHLEKFDPPSWKKLEQSTLYKNGVENLKRKAQEKYEKNKDIINKKPNSSSTSKKDKFDEALDEMERVHNFMVSLATPRNDENDIYEINEIVSFETPSSDEKDIYKVRENVKFASLNEGKIKNNLEYALGNSTLVGTIFMKDGIPYLRYNLSDTFEDITGIKRKAGVELEYGKPYDMLGPSKEIPLFDEKGMKK